MSKRELILDALQELLYEGTAGTASVQDIATKAGIAKGGLYYYYKSKEEVLDALVERQYNHVIETCRIKLATVEAPALEKIKLLLYFYRNTAVDQQLIVRCTNRKMPQSIRNQWPLSWDVWRQSLVKFCSKESKKTSLSVNIPNS